MDTSAIQSLVSMGVISSTDHLEAPDSERGDTPLIKASREANLQHLQLLVAAKANICAKNFLGATAVFVATQSGHAQVLQFLLKLGAPIDEVTHASASSVFIAAQKGHADCLKMLIESNANVNLTAQVGAVSPTASLSDSSPPSPMARAISVEGSMTTDGTYRMPSKSGVSPIFIASQEGKLEAVDLLISARANIDLPTNGGVTPVCIAAAEGRVECLASLIAAHANVNTFTNACQAEDLDDVTVRLSLGLMALFQQGGVTPVYIASQKGQIDTLRLLINAAGNCNTPTNDGSTAIWIAARWGYTECVEELLLGGAYFAAKFRGKTPKQIAKEYGHTKVADVLRQHAKKPF